MKELIDSIKKHEGYREKVYKDHLWYDTIGYGFAIKDLKLSEDICNIILLEKVEQIITKLTEKYDWFDGAEERIKEVVIEMCYQLGISGFSKFKKTISYLAKKDYENASNEMLDSKWAKVQTPSRAMSLSNKVYYRSSNAIKWRQRV